MRGRGREKEDEEEGRGGEETGLQSIYISLFIYYLICPSVVKCTFDTRCLTNRRCTHACGLGKQLMESLVVC